jgi:hypothetical protein
MSQPNVTIDVRVNRKSVDQMLLNLSSALSDSSLEEYLLTNGVGILSERTIDRFNAEGDDATGRWQPLAVTTQRIRQSLGYGAEHPINRRSDEMMDTVLSDPGEVTSASDVTLLWPGADLPQQVVEKLETAQHGKGNPNTPPRPVLAVSNIALDLVTEDLATHINSALMGSIII